MSKKHVNYYLRIQKNIERKIFVELFKNLYHFSNLKDYIYIGMGSYYFTDFTLFHRELGVKKLISIEHDTTNMERYRNNKPYNNIEINFSTTNDYFRKLKIDPNDKHIIWLDYVDIFEQSMVTDIINIVKKIETGSVLLVSLSIEYSNYVSKMPKHNAMTLEEEDKIVLEDLTDRSLGHYGFSDYDKPIREIYPETVAQIFENIVDDTLLDRNSSIEESSDKIEKCKLIEIHYDDSTKMLTLGWLFYKSENVDIFKKCNFSEIDFAYPNSGKFVIKTPILTYREILQLNQMLPTENIEEVELPGVPKSAIKNYEKLYKIFPNFFESL